MGCCYSSNDQNLIINEPLNFTGDQNDINSIHEKEKFYNNLKAQSNNIVSNNINIKKGDFDDDQNDIKILMLGAGECGKTTIFKQIKILKCGGFDADERESFVGIIRNSILNDMKLLIDFANDRGIELDNIADSMSELSQVIDESEMENPYIQNLFHTIWNDLSFKNKVYEDAITESVGVGDNADYFFDNVERILSNNYYPSDEDILKIRIRTTGLNSLKLLIGDETLKTIIIDVGGQQSERRKWKSIFSNVNYVIFVISMSDFDQRCFEESEEMNRTKDALNLFESIINEPYFKDIPFFLIFNKRDIFQKKMKFKSKEFQQIYNFSNLDLSNYNDCYSYIKNTFFKRAHSREENINIFAYDSCAMEKDNVNEIFQQICEVIMQQRS